MTEVKKGNPGNKKYTEEDKDIIRLIGAKLKAFRNALGLTRDEMAAKVNLSRNYLQAVESGNFGINTVTAIAFHNLGFNLNSLGDSDQPIMREVSKGKELVFDAKIIVGRLEQLIDFQNSQQRYNLKMEQRFGELQEKYNQLETELHALRGSSKDRIGGFVQ